MSGVRHLSHLGLGSALEQWEYPRGTFGVGFVTADVGLIRNAVLTLIAKNRNNPCNRPETLMILNSPLLPPHFAVGKRWSVSGWLCTGMIGVALEQLTPALKLDADWIACWAQERSPGCSLAHRCLAILR